VIDDPSGQPPGPAHGAALEAQIAAAERAVIARDERVRGQVQAIKERVVHRRGGIAIALAGGALLLARLVRGRRVAGGVVSPATGFKVGSLLWPLLPVALRRLLPPGLGPLAYGLLPALGQWVSGRTGQASKESVAPAPVRSAESVDLQRYLGRWYEVARLPTPRQKRCVADVMAVYEAAGNAISVLNTCSRSDGRTLSAHGLARVVEGSGNARLRVSFASRLWRALPATWSDYWILLADDDYRYALVGTPDRRHLWLLSRTPSLGADARQRLVEHARTQGYDTAQLTSTLQLGADR
jgi:apolipoprotein D and lipocalin family protein